MERPGVKRARDIFIDLKTNKNELMYPLILSTLTHLSLFASICFDNVFRRRHFDSYSLRELLATSGW